MISRIRERQAFRRLAADGTRIRSSTLWCICCPDPETTTTPVAFAIGRALGPAVKRNRLRRRLRAILRQADRSGSLPTAMLLIGATSKATEQTFDQLDQEMQSILEKARRVCSA